jgi:hypothetical protein
VANPIPSALALDLSAITNGDTADATPVEAALAALESALNEVSAALRGGASGQLLHAVDGSDVVWSSGEVAATDFNAAGLTGAAAARFVGGTTSGPPTTGTFAARDFVIDSAGHLWICTAGGTPGTWVGVTAAGLAATSPSAGVGYAAGAGGSVTQTTSISTAVTINKICGKITLFDAGNIGAGGNFQFVVNNSAVAAGDIVVLSPASPLANGVVMTADVTAGQFIVTGYFVFASATGWPFNFAVIKAVSA